jgi:hypothetical protein
MRVSYSGIFKVMKERFCDESIDIVNLWLYVMKLLHAVISGDILLCCIM